MSMTGTSAAIQAPKSAHCDALLASTPTVRTEVFSGRHAVFIGSVSLPELSQVC